MAQIRLDQIYPRDQNPTVKLAEQITDGEFNHLFKIDKITVSKIVNFLNRNHQTQE